MSIPIKIIKEIKKIEKKNNRGFNSDDRGFNSDELRGQVTALFVKKDIKIIDEDIEIKKKQYPEIIIELMPHKQQQAIFEKLEDKFNSKKQLKASDEEKKLFKKIAKKFKAMGEECSKGKIYPSTTMKAVRAYAGSPRLLRLNLASLAENINHINDKSKADSSTTVLADRLEAYKKLVDVSEDVTLRVGLLKKMIQKTNPLVKNDSMNFESVLESLAPIVKKLTEGADFRDISPFDPKYIKRYNNVKDGFGMVSKANFVTQDGIAGQLKFAKFLASESFDILEKLDNIVAFAQTSVAQECPISTSVDYLRAPYLKTIDFGNLFTADTIDALDIKGAELSSLNNVEQANPVSSFIAELRGEGGIGYTPLHERKVQLETEVWKVGNVVIDPTTVTKLAEPNMYQYTGSEGEIEFDKSKLVITTQLDIVPQAKAPAISEKTIKSMPKISDLMFKFSITEEDGTVKEKESNHRILKYEHGGQTYYVNPCRASSFVNGGGESLVFNENKIQYFPREMGALFQAVYEKLLNEYLTGMMSLDDFTKYRQQMIANIQVMEKRPRTNFIEGELDNTVHNAVRLSGEVLESELPYQVEEATNPLFTKVEAKLSGSSDAFKSFTDWLSSIETDVEGRNSLYPLAYNLTMVQKEYFKESGNKDDDKYSAAYDSLCDKVEELSELDFPEDVKKVLKADLDYRIAHGWDGAGVVDDINHFKEKGILTDDESQKYLKSASKISERSQTPGTEDATTQPVTRGGSASSPSNSPPQAMQSLYEKAANRGPAPSPDPLAIMIKQAKNRGPAPGPDPLAIMIKQAKNRGPAPGPDPLAIMIKQAKNRGPAPKGIVANPTMTAKQALKTAQQAGEDQNTNMRARSNAFSFRRPKRRPKRHPKRHP